MSRPNDAKNGADIRLAALLRSVLAEAIVESKQREVSGRNLRFVWDEATHRLRNDGDPVEA